MKISVLLSVALIGGVLSKTADKYKDTILNKHNNYRRQQGGSNINKLYSRIYVAIQLIEEKFVVPFGADNFSVSYKIKPVWSDTLAREADAWVSKCDFKHQQAGRGENLDLNTASDEAANIEQAITNWYNEVEEFKYGAERCRPSCHYTQVVWYNTKEVGCAMKRCPKINVYGRVMENAWFFGCWYDPQYLDPMDPYTTFTVPFKFSIDIGIKSAGQDLDRFFLGLKIVKPPCLEEGTLWASNHTLRVLHAVSAVLDRHVMMPCVSEPFTQKRAVVVFRFKSSSFKL